MTTTALFDLLYFAVLLILLISSYIVKKNIIRAIKNNDHSNESQIKSKSAIANTIYYAVSFIIIMMIVLPLIISAGF